MPQGAGSWQSCKLRARIYIAAQIADKLARRILNWRCAFPPSIEEPK